MVSRYLSHVGLAMFNHTGFPTQWVLVISTNEMFKGRVLCGTVGMTVNGYQEIWTECDGSPAFFNRAATFAGVLHVAALGHSVEAVHAAIKSEGIVMRANPAYTDQYVLQVIGCIGNRYFGSSSLLCREKEFYETIQACIPILNRAPRTTSSFPVVSVPQGGIHLGKLKRH
jgi:hypothetical protein